MVDAKLRKTAEGVYELICKMLDGRNWKYDREDAELILHFGVNGEDIPMEFLIVVDAERQLVRLMSLLPFTAGADKLTELAIATSYANYKMADGSFDFDLVKGRIVYRMTTSYRESLLSEELFNYMVSYACYAVDKYNDRFLMLIRGALSVEQFIQGA